MKTFLRRQLETFPRAVDAALDQPVDVVVIGGSAAALHYGAGRATHDIDTWTNIDAGLAAAAGQRTFSDVLVERFCEEMSPIGDPVRLRRNFLVVVERLFPEAAESVASRLRRTN